MQARAFSKMRNALLLSLALACPNGMLLRAQAQTVDEISVVTPTTSVNAGGALSVEWSYSASGGTTGDLNSFTISLHYCGEDSSNCSSNSGGSVSSCGESYSELCTRDDGICVDSDGSYDVIVPADTAPGSYSVMVTLYHDITVASCSSAFNVTAPKGSAAAAAEGEPSLEVSYLGDELEVGSAFTARWTYDDGAGEAEGTFEVNLRLCDSESGECNDGGCGTLAASLCEDPGCYDPGTGDYDVVIPADQEEGQYTLEVINVDDQTWGCLESPFDIVIGNDSSPTLAPLQSPMPSPAPRSVATTVAPAGAVTPAPTDGTSTTIAPSAVLTPTPTTGAPTPVPSVATAALTPIPTAGATTPTPTAASPTPQPTPAAPTPSPVTPTATTSSDSEGTPGSPGTPPSPVPAKVDCDPDAELEFVYTQEDDTKLALITVSHASRDSSEAGCLTLTKIYEWLGSGPAGVAGTLLYTVDPDTGVENPNYTNAVTGTWLLRSSVEVTNGVTFAIKGTAVDGGDCDELKLYSTSGSWYRVMGHGGNIDIDSTLIRSWDTKDNAEHAFGDKADGKTPRSYISCVSEISNEDETCDGVSQNDMGECRMDIVDSELGHLGYDETEGYGISWKVRGLCEDLSNMDTLFDSVRVYGDMLGSNIHHMWYGMYSYGHLGGVWSNNLMHNNHVYGFDPHDDSDYLTIKGNTVWNNGNHGIIASKRCDHLRVADNVVYDNGGSGIMLHKSSDDSVVEGNNCTGNYDAGISLVESSRCSVKDNTFVDNRWGFRVILGSTDNVLEGNVLTANRYSDIYAYYGADEEVAEVAPFTGVNVNNIFRNNEVNHVVKTVVDIENSNGTEISSNTFSGENGHFVFLDSIQTHVVDNTGDAASGLSDDITGSCFTPESDRKPVC